MCRARDHRHVAPPGLRRSLVDRVPGVHTPGYVIPPLRGYFANGVGWHALTIGKGIAALATLITPFWVRHAAG